MKGLTLDELTRMVVAFRNDRDWQQFHNSKDVAISLSLEAAEVLELMQWRSGSELASHLKESKQQVGEELSDVLYWVLLLSHDLEIDLATAFCDKLALNAAKYPVEKSRGSSRKYTKL